MTRPFMTLRGRMAVLVVAFAGLQPFPVHSREPAQDLIETVAAFNAAIVAKDRVALDRFFVADFFWITGDGKRSDKKGFIDALTAAGLEIHPYVPADVRWLVAGDAALLAALNRLEGSNDGKPFVDPHRYSNLWLLHDGEWRLAFIQVTPLSE